MSFLFGGSGRDRERREAASERSDEERERARLEREARRAARDGGEPAAAVRLEERDLADGGEIRASRGGGRARGAAAPDPLPPADGAAAPPAAALGPLDGDGVGAPGQPSVEPYPLDHDGVGAPGQPSAEPYPLDHDGVGAPGQRRAEPYALDQDGDGRSGLGSPELHTHAQDPEGAPGQPTAAFDPLADDRNRATGQPTAAFYPLADDRDGAPGQPTAAFDPLAPDPSEAPAGREPAFDPLVYDPDAAPARPAAAHEPLEYDLDAAPTSPPPDREPPPYAPDTDDVPAVVVRGRRDAPAGVRRVRASAVASAAGAEGPPRFGAPLRPPARPRRRPRWLLLVLPLLVLLAAAWAAWSLFQPLGGDEDGQEVQVRIPEGLTAAQIGDLLAERGVVDSGFFFSLRARLADDRGGLRSGTVDLREGMSYDAALDELTKAAPPAPRTIKVTIPEGRSRREVGPVIREAGLRGSYTAATRRSSELDPRDYGAPRGASLEGFLFPATYDVRPNARTSQLVRQQLQAFEENFGEVDLARARRAGLSRYDVLIIASMIEREATLARERRLISAVIYNRLQDGMNLGIDATIRYALNQWNAPLKVSELKADTPYNTRTRPGLPPGPIGSPGLASIKAAANPANSDALFYVVRPCGNGAHAFSTTGAEFQRDVAAYNRAREARGGKDPSRC